MRHIMRKDLTPKQKGYVEGLSKGISKDQSAILAGASKESVKRMDASPAVQEELARIRKEAIENTGITKEQVIAMFVQAADYARLLGDAMGLIAAGRELGKMLGYYAPEVKKIEKGINATEFRKALKDLSDEELFKLAHARTIDGEATVVKDLPNVQ
jgi:hypothetical protein